MSKERINRLLEKYWSGETTLEEESEIRQYFLQEDVDPSLMDVAPLFRYFQIEQDRKLDDGIILPSGKEQEPHEVEKHWLLWPANVMKIAAGIAVFMLATWFIRNEVRETDPSLNNDTYQDPKQAFEETKKALLMVSRSFGQAEKEAQKINLFNEAQEKIQKDRKSDQSL